jgi:hypothetical protein
VTEVAKIFPDTNCFIDFYRAGIERLDVFDELEQYKGSLVLTQQTVMEFRRNRVSTLKRLVAEFDKTTKVMYWLSVKWKIAFGALA